jgi:transposase
VIRRWHFRQGMAIREIKRRTGLSRNTIRKYLRADAVEPVFKVPDRPSKLDPFAEKLTGWLRVEAGKSRKQKRTAKQLYADLAALGYDGSYARVAAFARDWKRNRQYEQQTSGRGTFVPLVFQPGEAFQFDWSEDYAVLGGKQVKLQVAHTKLSHSRAFIVRAYLLQTHEMLFDALTQAFRVLRGVPQRGIFDNMKTAVDKIGRGKARQVNARFAALASHYLFETDFAIRLRAGRRGKSRRTFRMPGTAWQPMPSFPDLAALNAWLEEQCIAQWADIQHGVLPGTIADVHADEVGSLMPVGRPFDGFVEQTKRVSPTCLIAFERNRYSVPASFANRPVSLRIYPERLVVVAEGKFCASTNGSSTDPIRSRGARSMTGGITWLSFSASPAPCAMERRSWRCPKPSGTCRLGCSSGLAVTRRWSRSSPLSCTMTNRLFYAPSNWLWRMACRPRSMFSTFCIA